MSPKVDKKHKENRKKQILNASYKCFSRIGFDRSTMRDICREAKLSPGAVYSYFSSKQEIIQALADTSAEWNKKLFEKTDDSLSCRKKLKEIMLTFCTKFQDPKAELGIRIDISVWAASLYDDTIKKLVKKSQARMANNIKALIIAGQEEGSISKNVDPETSAKFLLSVLLGATLQQYFDPNFNMDTYKDLIEEFMDKGF